MSNFWGAINAIRREATKLRTDLYSAGCFTAQEAAMDLDRAAAVLEAAGKVDKRRFAEGIDEANQFGQLHRNVMGGYGLFIEDLEAILAALPDEVKK